MHTITRRDLLHFAGATILAGPVGAQETGKGTMETGFLNRTVTVDGETSRYVVYVPREYTPEKKWPVILFLHGAGERGSDGLKQSQVGLPAAIRFHPERFPAVVVIPQCPENQWWNGDHLPTAVKALDATVAEFSTDPARVYLTGLSMGGFGSFRLASEQPERWAAVVPICGGGEPETMASKLKDVPMWVFHGDADTVVPVERSRQMVEAIKQAGGTRVRYSELPGVGHNSWDPAYSDPKLATWLFEQRK